MRSASRCSPWRVIVDLGDAEVAHNAHYGGLRVVNKGVGQGPWHETHPRAGGSLAARACPVVHQRCHGPDRGGCRPARAIVMARFALKRSLWWHSRRGLASM
jgi:hypothetical protein